MIEMISVYCEHGEPGWHVPASRTENHILLMVTDGTIVYTIDGKPFPLKKGDALFIPQGVIRLAANNTSSAHDMYAAHFRYSGDGERLPLLSDPRVCYVIPFAFDYLKQRFSLLTQYWLRKSSYADTICHSVLLEMLALVQQDDDARILPGSPYKLVLQLQDYILNHYRGTIRMTELAACIERTPNYASSIFKQVTGRTITEYIQQIRIAAACDLLMNSKMSIGEIADFLGFCEQSYFNKVFKKTTGASPSAYIKEQIKIWRK